MKQAWDERGFSAGFARSMKNGTRGYVIVAQNVLLAQVWQAWKGLTTAVKYFCHGWACENRSIHGTFAADFDPEVLIVLIENHGTVNKLHLIYMYVWSVTTWAKSSLFVLYHLAYLWSQCLCNKYKLSIGKLGFPLNFINAQSGKYFTIGQLNVFLVIFVSSLDKLLHMRPACTVQCCAEFLGVILRNTCPISVGVKVISSALMWMFKLIWVCTSRKGLIVPKESSQSPHSVSPKIRFIPLFN